MAEKLSAAHTSRIVSVPFHVLVRGAGLARAEVGKGLS